MKSYYIKKHSRIWTTGLVSLGLGLAGMTGLIAAPGQTDTTPKPDDDLQAWEQQFSGRMEHIQKEMDDLFRDSMNNVDWTGSAFAGWPKFDASATVQDRGNNYVATFDLPKRDLSNVKVTVKDGLLTVNASAEQTVNPDSKNTASKAPAEESTMLDAYEQLVTLPGPVDASKVTVDKQGESIVVTIPKKDVKSTADR
jgi:HSP20 family molecular chaperone IbpA